MVASAATTQPANSAPGATVPGGQSPDSPSSPLPSSLSLSHSVTESLLDHLASPHHSLASIAEHHNLSLSTLLAWLELPEIREKMAFRESIAYRHVRYVAALNLSHAVHTTIRTLEAFNAVPRTEDPLDPNYLRLAVHARKAAWLLLRFSRLTPVSDLDLASVRNTLRDTASVSRYAEGGEPLPAQPAAANPQPARAQPQPQHQPAKPAPAPVPSDQPTQPPAESRAQDLLTPIAADAPPEPSAHVDPAERADSARHVDPADPVDHPAAPTLALPNLVVLSTPALPDPTDMVALVEQLTALAASLGIGAPGFDDPAGATTPGGQRSPARPTSVHDPGALVTVGPLDST